MSAAELLLPAGTTSFVPTDDGAELAVTDLGSGPAVVLAHGWTERREVWAPVVHRLLDRGCRVVLYDQRGHGSSSSGTAGYTIAGLADDLRAVLEALDVRDAVLVGHSMGGMTLLSLAKEHPDVLHDRARGLALVSTGAGGLGGTRLDAPAAALMAQDRFIALFRSPLGPLLVRRTLGRGARREHIRLTRDMFVSCTPEARRGWLAAMQSMDLRAVLASLDLPTVVVVGSMDRLTPPKLADELVGSIPGARLVTVPDRGHQLPMEAPDVVADAVASLL
jgi:pimeloyl-ACP methyl ester carboxylesterase